MKSFEDLEVYQKGGDFTTNVFLLTENSRIIRNIVYQLERASLSISNHNAEGLNYNQTSKFVKFIHTLKGSYGVSRNLLTVTQ